MRGAIVMVAGAVLALGHLAHADAPDSGGTTEAPTAKYSQKVLLKNWALSVCLAQVAKDPSERDDANATAGAYLEFGHQQVEAYDQLRKLADQYAARKYAGSVASEFNTMKCIDLFHSRELDALAGKLSKTR
jgi:hypothetical protein